MKILNKCSTLATALMLVPSVSFAASSSEWVKPATEKIDSLRAGLVEIAVPLIGVAIIAVGLGMAFQENPNWKRIGTVVLAGILITAGPALVMSFLGS